MAILTPTLLIGVGSSGLDVLEGVQKLMYETYAESKFDPVEYVCIETDTKNKARSTPKGDKITYLHTTIPSDQISHTVTEITNRYGQRNTSWLPSDSATKIQKLDSGAKNMRYAGRMILWHDLMGRRLITSTVSQKIAALTLPTVVAKDYSPHKLIYDPQTDTVAVYVIGTLTGGTGSGMFIDLGYILRACAGKNITLVGIFGLPDGYSSDFSGKIHRANAYRAVEEVSYFMNAENRFEELIPELGESLERYRGSKPYDLLYFVSTRWGTGDPLGEKYDDKSRSLYNVVSFAIFANIIGLSTKRNAKLINQGAGATYYTFGISAALYPRYSLLEGAACAIGKKIVKERWFNDEYYIDIEDAYREKKIDRTRIQREAKKFFYEELMKEGFLAFSTKGMDIKETFMIPLDREDFTKDEFIAKVKKDFSDDFQQMLINQMSLIHKGVTTRVDKEVRDLLEKVENVNYVSIFLDEINAAREEQIKFSQKKPYIASSWSEYVAKTVEVLHKNFGMVGKKKMLLFDRLMLLFNELKERVLYEYIKGEQINEYIKQIKADIKTLQGKFIGSEAARGVFALFDEREKEVFGEVHDRFRPLYRIYEKGSFEEDLEYITNQYVMSKGDGIDIKNKSVGKRTVGINGAGGLFGFMHGGDAPVVFEKMKNSLMEGLKGVLPDMDVGGRAIKDIERMRGYIANTGSGLVKVIEGKEAIDLPTYIIGESDEEIERFKSAISGLGVVEFDNAKPLKIPELKHMVLLYKERGILSNHDLKDYKDFESCYAGDLNPGDLPDGMKSETWRNSRNAYDVKWRENYKNLVRLTDFIANIGFKWSEDNRVVKKNINDPRLVLMGELLNLPGFKVAYAGEDRTINLKDYKKLESIAATERVFSTRFEDELKALARSITEDQIRGFYAQQRAHWERQNMTVDDVIGLKDSLVK